MLGIGLMLVAACCNAAASVLQRTASRDESRSAAMSIGMITRLMRRPVWLLGVLSMLIGFVLHGISISVSRIALVQPLLIVELPLTILLAAVAFGVRPGSSDVLAIGLASCGLVMFEVCLAPSGGDPGGTAISSWIIAGSATAAAVGVLVMAGLRGSGDRRAALFGIAAGAAFGLNSSLIAGVGAAVADGGNLITSWQTYAVAVVGPASFLLQQTALAAGDLMASQPGMTLTNPLVAIIWGLVVFDEHSRGGIWTIGVVAGLLMIIAGTIWLARSPLLSAHQGRAGSGSR